jgi:hypothetical protein
MLQQQNQNDKSKNVNEKFKYFCVTIKLSKQKYPDTIHSIDIYARKNLMTQPLFSVIPLALKKANL